MQNTIGVAGLAVMGENLVLNMESKGLTVSVYNRTYDKTRHFLDHRARGKSIAGFEQVKDFVASLERPRKIMMMLKAGAPVDDFITRLMPFLDRGDMIIDGGNSLYLDTMRRAEMVEAHGLLYIGTGVSGGEQGALKGPSIMPGGSEAARSHLEPIFSAIAAKAADGSACCTWIGPGGAGHFVKMVHNGIEYGDMQIICEAYQLMKDVLGLDVDDIHRTFSQWNEGKLGSYLIQITADIARFLDDDGTPLLDKILDMAGQKGTGKWTVNAALEFGVPLSLISESIFARCISSMKDIRTCASEKIAGPCFDLKEDPKTVLDDLAQALYCAKIISYTQGFCLMQQASDELDWNLNLAEIAKIWRGGCIIRSRFLDKIATAYVHEPTLPNMLFDPHFNEEVKTTQKSLRKILGLGIAAGIPMPSHASALNYIDSLRTVRLPANLLQAQRDYFGAHMYERIDKPRGKWFHTNWTGTGSSTTSTTYSK